MQTNLSHVFLITLFFTGAPSFLIYKFGGFEMAVILAICLFASIVVAAIVGVENTIKAKGRNADLDTHEVWNAVRVYNCFRSRKTRITL